MSMQATTTINSTASKGLTASGLKWIAILAMFVDHFGAIFLSQLGPDWQELYTLSRCIGRFAFPIFAFLLTEGFVYTHSRAKYARNLFLFALISEIPFDLGFSDCFFNPSYQNVFFTLLLGLLTLCALAPLLEAEYDGVNPALKIPGFFAAGILAMHLFLTCQIGEYLLYYYIDRQMKPWLYACGGILFLLFGEIVSRKWEKNRTAHFCYCAIPLCIGVITADLLMTDYGGWGVFVISCMYLYRQNPERAFSLGCLGLILMSSMEAFALLMLPVIKRYNGKRGRSMKYFFYAFYPCHILMIYLLGVLCGFYNPF